MRCAECNSDNRDDARFCVGCGAALSVPCPRCGFASTPGERFCGGCGLRLGETPGTAPAASDSSAPVPTGERRQVTVLFADLSGSTRLAGELDAEELHGVVNRFFQAADGIVQDYGGTVDKHIGDAVMALFGAPVAHGDDPQRAVRAALEMHGAVAGLSDEIGRKLEIHVGIASGEVIAAGVGRREQDEYTVTGESVNLAARLVDRAGPGETLISGAVYAAVSGLARCEPLGEVSVKGLDRAVMLYRVRDLAPGAPDRARRALVGRTAELSQFSAVIDACLKTGNGQAVLVRGEAGIGKTRLVEEFMRLAGDRGYATHRAAIFDFGVGRHQDAARTLVCSLLGISISAATAARRTAAETGLSAGLFDADKWVFVNDLLNLAQSDELRAVYEAMDNATRVAGKQAVVEALIAGVSAQQPLVLVVEDVHWADSLILRYLAAMTRTVSGCPAVLVMTTRIEGDQLDQAWRTAARGSPLMTIDLGPLRAAEVEELAGGFVDATQSYVAQCIARAQGNPLFLEQLLLNAKEGEARAVPATIQSLILARMDRLEPGDKQALQAASVIGQQFSVATLRHLIADPDYGCKVLTDHTLVRPEGDGFLFAHALIRDGAYSSLLKARARALHERAAEWYAERDPVLHARHLDQAEHANAAQAYLEAARALADAYHFEGAVVQVERGLQIARDDAVRFALTCLHGELLLDLGKIAESIESYRNALPIAGDDAKKCLALIGIAAGMRITDRLDEAFEALDAAQALADRQGLARELSRIHYDRGNLFFPRGNIEGCLEEQNKALAYARDAGAIDCEARSLGGLGDAFYTQGRMITARGYFERCVDLCRQQGLGRIETGNRYMVAWTQLYGNENRASAEEALSAGDTAALIGDRRAEICARMTAGRALHEIGEFARAKEQLDQGLVLAEGLGAARFKPFLEIFLARVARAERAGDPAIEATLIDALEISRKTGLTFVGPWVLSTLALVAVRPDARRKYLDQGEAILRGGCVGHNYLAFYPDAMEVALEARDWDAVERYAAGLEDYTRQEPLPRTDFLVARGRALAEFGGSRSDKATLEALARLRDQALRSGIGPALPALEAALASA